MIDATNQETMADVRDTLHQVMAETAETKIPILIFANKQDVEGALAYSEIRNELALAGDSDLRRKIRIQEASGLTNLGLQEGFTWIVDMIKVNEQNSRWPTLIYIIWTYKHVNEAEHVHSILQMTTLILEIINKIIFRILKLIN